MTNEEKIVRHDTLEEIRQRIRGCFGTADGIFAGHQFDEDRAKALRKLADQNKITLNEIQEIALGYLVRKNYQGEHIKQQIAKVTAFFSKKIS